VRKRIGKRAARKRLEGGKAVPGAQTLYEVGSRCSEGAPKKKKRVLLRGVVRGELEQDEEEDRFAVTNR